MSKALADVPARAFAYLLRRCTWRGNMPACCIRNAVIAKSYRCITLAYGSGMMVIFAFKSTGIRHG